MEEERLGAAKWSVIVNIFVIMLKLGVAVYTGSLGILAEFVHTFFDLSASVLAYLGIKKATEPADETHHYGHERFENISSLAQAVLIAITSLFILYEAYNRLAGAEHVVKESVIGIAVMGLTLAIDIKIAHFLHKKSARTGSPALEADAYHFSTDVLSTLAVIIGLGATAIGYPIADVLSAVVVSLIMLYVSFELAKKAVLVMLDKAPNNQAIERIALVISRYPGITGYHSLRARMAGNRVFVDVSIHLKSKISLEAAHEIAENLESRIIEECPYVKEVITHIEPEGPHDSLIAASMKRIFE